MPDVDVNDGGAIAVLGLWHLGSVTAACVAESGRSVIGVDPDADVVAALGDGRPLVSEPGLAELTSAQIAAGRLRFTDDPTALADVSVAWVTFDTPVDADDRADVESVLGAAAQQLAHLPAGALVVISSQLPVGSAAELAARLTTARGESSLRFAAVPENLRLGQALDSFRSPDRVVAGVRDETDRRELAALLAPFTDNVEWMGIESAEMTKHAINGFLATSVAYINEIAGICESVGADASEVARGLKSERRIGPRAYLSPGDAFAGGTLARDIGFLRDLAGAHGLPAYVSEGVADANAAHKQWNQRKLVEMLARGADTSADRPLQERRVTVWGLTYKPGTDTLRRSSAIELCRWLVAAGATVVAHDPAVQRLPDELGHVALCARALDAVQDAEALVVCTGWPMYRDVPTDAVVAAMEQPLVIDAAGFLHSGLGGDDRVRYVRVGTPGSRRPDRGQLAAESTR